eukprot:1654810-Amphidinium_carterae.1
MSTFASVKFSHCTVPVSCRASDHSAHYKTVRLQLCSSSGSCWLGEKLRALHAVQHVPSLSFHMAQEVLSAGDSADRNRNCRGFVLLADLPQGALVDSPEIRSQCGPN